MNHNGSTWRIGLIEGPLVYKLISELVSPVLPKRSYALLTELLGSSNSLTSHTPCQLTIAFLGKDSPILLAIDPVFFSSHLSNRRNDIGCIVLEDPMFEDTYEKIIVIV